MKKVKVLYATTYDRNVNGGPEVFYEYVKKGFRGLLDASGVFEVEAMDIVFSKTRLLEKIEEGYNVIITDGTISSVDESGDLVKDGIGFSTIKGWLKDRNDLDVIIVEESASKGKAKIGRLFKELGYYNICFKAEKIVWRDFMNDVVKLLVSPRTAKQALTEYGIEEYEDIKEYLRQNPWVLEGKEAPVEKSVSSYNNANNAEGIADVVKEVVVEEVVVEEITEEVTEAIKDNLVKENESADINMNKDNLSKESVDDMSLEEIEAMFNREAEGFKDFSGKAAEVVEEFAEPDETEEEVIVEEKPFGFGGAFFAGEGESFDKTKEVVEEEKKSFEDQECYVHFASDTEGDMKKEPFDDKKESDFNISFASMGQKEPVEAEYQSAPVEEGVYRNVDSSSEVMAFTRSGSKSGMMPAKGVIRGVVDYDTIIVEFDNMIPNIETLDEYRCIVKVRSGKKGMVVNGRYKSANISFDAYLETVVDERTVMLEVPEFDCEEKRDFLEGKESNFVFVKM